MSGKRRKALERAFKALHQGKVAPRAEWQEREARKDDPDRPEFYIRSIHRALKKRPAEFGVGVTDEKALREAKVSVIRSLHAREPLPEEAVRALDETRDAQPEAP